jgi:hypothetical protein
MIPGGASLVSFLTKLDINKPILNQPTFQLANSVINPLSAEGNYMPFLINPQDIPEGLPHHGTLLLEQTLPV